MKVGFHPVFDNPVRMSYVPGWRSINDLIERLGDLEHAVGDRRVIPARWEPYYSECPCCRYAGAYAWSRSQLEHPSSFATALALFPGEEEQLTTRIGHANWLILSTKGERSKVTRKLMLAEALGLWEDNATDWLEQISESCAALGVQTSVVSLHQQVQQALQPLAKAVPDEDEEPALPNIQTGFETSHGFDKDLLQMNGWTPDPGLVVLPVDGRIRSLAREILLLDLNKVVLLRARRSARAVAWDKVTLVHLFDGAVTFEITDEPPLVVAGYKHPEDILRTIQECYMAATERILQAVATQVTHPTP